MPTVTCSAPAPAPATCAVRDLKHALALVKPFVGTRSHIGCLQYVRVSADGLRATDMVGYAFAPLDLSGLGDEVRLVRPADVLAALKGLRAGDAVTIDASGVSLSVAGVNLPGADACDWPADPVDSMRDAESGGVAWFWFA